MSNRDLYDNGIDEVSKSYAILENVLILALIILGFSGMYPLSVDGIPWISILYALFAITMLGFVLRKHLCTGCYYYGRWCHCGWGKLSSAIFKKDSGNQRLGGKLGGFTWGVLMGLPIVAMIAIMGMGIISLIDELIFFIPFLVLVAINGMLHKKDCEKCKMRFICVISAAKKS